MAGEENSVTADKKVPGRVARVFLWFAGSALVGSAALVLWNRRTLKGMLEAASDPAAMERDRDGDGIY